MSSANSDGFTSSFPTWISFIYFSSLIIVIRMFKIMLNKKDDSGHHCLVPHLRGIVFSFSPLSMIFALCLSCMAFIMLRSVLSACFLKNFYRTSMLNFVKSFSCVYWDDHMVFILQFVNVVYHIDWLVDFEKSLYSWGKSHMIMVYDLFNIKK